MPKRPIEVANASIACFYAWELRDRFVEAGDKDSVREMNWVCDFFEERYNFIYREWQNRGGTSDIICFLPEFDELVDLHLTQEYARV